MEAVKKAIVLSRIFGWRHCLVVDFIIMNHTRCCITGWSFKSLRKNIRYVHVELENYFVILNRLASRMVSLSIMTTFNLETSTKRNGRVSTSFWTS